MALIAAAPPSAFGTASNLSVNTGMILEDSSIPIDYFVPPEIAIKDVDEGGVDLTAVEGLNQYLVPPVITEPDPLIEGAARFLAVAEGLLLTAHRTRFRYPDPPKIPMFYRTTMDLKTLLSSMLRGGWPIENRTLKTVDAVTRYTAMGPLTLAVDRAIHRSQKKGATGPVQVLEIGAGQRLVPRQLKRIFGDRIWIHELSPKYSELEGAIDITLPAAEIDEAELPSDTYELVYSHFGSFYGRDQLAVLKKVVRSLKEGGEAYFMWPIGQETDAMAEAIRRHPLAFQMAGLDIGVSLESESHLDGVFYFVWVQKRAEGNIDIDGIFADAAGGEGENFRFSLRGPYLPHASHDLLESVISGLAQGMSRLLGIDIKTMEYKLTDRFSDSDDGALEKIVKTTERYVRERLAKGTRVPFSVLISEFLGGIIPLIDSDWTLADIDTARSAELQFLSYIR